MRSRRGQMEILGLAIIMVIVILGILLALKFFFFKTEDNPAQAARDVQLGGNLLDTMLETTVVCHEVPLSVLLKDCVETFPLGTFQCPPISAPGNPADVMIPGGNSCQYLNATIGYLLNSTLTKWGRKYEFDIPDYGIHFANPPEGCPTGYQKATRPRPIGGITVTLELKLCQ